MWPSLIPLTNSSPARGLHWVRCQLSCLSVQLKRKGPAQSQINSLIFGLTTPPPISQSNTIQFLCWPHSQYYLLQKCVDVGYLAVAGTPGLIILYEVMFVAYVENNCLKYIVLSFVSSSIPFRIVNCTVQYIMWWIVLFNSLWIE